MARVIQLWGLPSYPKHPTPAGLDPVEHGVRLASKGVQPPTFVSPNVDGVEKDHTSRVFDEFTK